MSGSTIGGVFGAVVGAYFGNPQLGYAIGYAIGGAIDPDHINGPRLGDMPVQTAQEGAPRPIVYGSPQPFPGNIILAGPKNRRIVEDEQDKGGPTTDHEEVDQTYAIRICEGPAYCIQAWRDGKLVYDRTGSGVLDPDSAAFASKALFYIGDETQLPDAVLEGLPAENGGGAGNVNAYRGTAYVRVERDNLTRTGGRIPNYEFRMASTATVTPGESGIAWAITDLTGMSLTDDGTDWLVPVEDPGFDGGLLLYGGGTLLRYTSSSGRLSTDQAETWSADNADISSGGPGAYINERFWLVQSPNIKYSVNGRDWNYIPLSIFGALSSIGGNPGMLVVGDNAGRVRVSLDNGQNFGAVINVFNGAYVTAISSNSSPIVVGSSDGRFAYTNDGVTFTPATTCYTPPGNNDAGIARIVQADGRFVAVSTNLDGGKSAFSASGAIWSFATGTDGHGGHDVANHGGLWVSVGANWTTLTSTDGESWTNRDNNFDGRAAITSVSPLPCGGIPIPDAPGYFVNTRGEICGPGMDVATPGTVYLSEIELDIAQRCGVPASKMDVSADTAVVVDGYLIGRQMQGRAALQTLGAAYYRDYPEYDLQIHSVPRGRPSVVTLTDEDFLISTEDEQGRRQAIELPRKLNLFFSDPAANYARVPVPAERESLNVPSTGVVSVELPLVFNRDVAAQKADIMLKVMTEDAQGDLKRELPAYEFAYLVASDNFNYNSKRWRIDKADTIDGVLKIECKRDRVTNYISAATANGVLDPTAPVSNTKGPSLAVVMNLPRLRSGDNQPGMYIAVTGVLPAWPGALIYVSVDGGASEQYVATISNRATMGQVLSITEDSAGDFEPLLVEVYDNRELESVTVEQLAARENAFAIITNDEAEIGQFQTATENSNGDWELTDTTRGLLGTDEGTHGGGSKFVLLDGAVLFIPIDISHAGKTLIFRAVTRGTAPELNETISIIFDPQFTGPETTDFYTNLSGEKYTNDAGEFYYRT